MKQRRGVITISEHLVKQALHMPEACNIIGGQVVYRYGCPTLELVIEGPDLPEVEIGEGQSTPEIMPTITYKPESWTWDWGTKP